MDQTRKKSALALDLNEWASWFEENRFPKFRAKQVLHWIYKKNISQWQETHNLPQDLRQLLMDQFIIQPFENIDLMIDSSDGTKKAVITLYDQYKIEAVLMPGKKRNTLCLSSQVGCAMDCKFCATGKMGFIRNLTVDEMVGQWYWASQTLGDEDRVDNIVFMGMGEPFLNYENVIKTLAILQADWGAGIGARKLTVSTVGIIPRIIDFAKDGGQVRLSLSLHAFDDDVRNSIMPINKKYNMTLLRDAIKKYFEISGRKITLEYVLIKDVNDSLENIENLKNLFLPYIHSMNVIHYNPIPQENFESTTFQQTKEFSYLVSRNGINATTRISKGRQIQAACGQLIK